MGGWEEIYRREGRGFMRTHSAFQGLVDLFRARGVRRVLDLGSGTGRHIVLLAKECFEVYGMDASPTGVEITKEMLKRDNLRGDVRVGDIYERLPYSDGFFDAIISTQTLHHNTTEKIKQLVGRWRESSQVEATSSSRSRQR